MIASGIRLTSLLTVGDCEQAINRIESDYRNVVGGYKAWMSGRQTYLTTSAVNKIKAINARYDRMFDGSDE